MTNTSSVLHICRYRVSYVTSEISFTFTIKRDIAEISLTNISCICYVHIICVHYAQVHCGRFLAFGKRTYRLESSTTRWSRNDHVSIILTYLVLPEIRIP